MNNRALHALPYTLVAVLATMILETSAMGKDITRPEKPQTGIDPNSGPVLQRPQRAYYFPETYDLDTETMVNDELALINGRETRIPVSYTNYIKVTKTTTLNPMVFRARVYCESPTDTEDMCNPAILLVVKNGSTVVDVQREMSNLPTITNGQGAIVTYDQKGNSTYTYEIVVYSENRATAVVEADQAFTDPAVPPTYSNVWTDAISGTSRTMNNSTIGGTEMLIGRVQATDFISVHSQHGANDATWMYVFDHINNKAVFVQRGADMDPTYAFPSGWNDNVYVIFSKDTWTGYEAFVDVVLGPLSTADTSIAGFPTNHLSCSGTMTSRLATCLSPTFTLTGGTTLVSVDVVASIAELVGASRGTGSDVTCNSSYPKRGRGNRLAFRMVIKENGTIRQDRYVPMGAIGSSGANRFGFTFRAKPGVNYSVELYSVGVTVGNLRYRRHPDIADFKVAESNLEYGGTHGQQEGTLANVAQLLMGKVTYGDVLQIYERNNRARWRWEADLAVFNEIYSPTEAGLLETYGEAAYGDATVPLSMKYAKGKYVSFGEDRENVVLARPIMSSGLAFTTAQYAGFTYMDTGDGTSHSCHTSGRCMLHDESGGLDEAWYALPTKTRAPRIGSTGTVSGPPMVTFAVYTPDGDQPVGRMNTTTSLVNLIKDMILDVPSAFNEDGVASYTHAKNRMILAGDFNTYNNSCSEINDTLRQLRAAFGYAVDVSMAVQDANLRTWDHHYNGIAISSLSAGTYVSSCVVGDHVESGSYSDCPYFFRHKWLWENETTTRYSSSNRHTWWAQTAPKYHERHDVILLVGKGWENDDPVLQYKVMSNRDDASPSNNYGAGGVQFVETNCTSIEGHDLTSSQGYKPEYEACASTLIPGGAAGAPAVVSDHVPIGVRLRVLNNN